jgi:riboflavin synthase
MFTGLVQAVSSIQGVNGNALRVAAPKGAWEDPLRIGESINVNGVCLTLVESIPDLKFELSGETLNRSTLGGLKAGDLVNLERALMPTDRMGGHIVQGHVDGVGSLLNISEKGTDKVFRFGVPENCDRYLVDKGSIAIDGISLTIVRPSAGAFDTSIVPHTFQNTNLKTIRVDQPVNLEFDILVKYVEKLVR